MNRRQIIIYSIAAVVAVYGFYFHFLSGKPDKKSSVAVPRNDTMQAKPDETAETISIAYATVEVSEEQPDERTYPGRNPFRNRDVTQGNRSSSAGIPVQQARLNVTAISEDGPRSLIIANNKVIRIGEKIDGWKLIRVESEKALFDGPDGSLWIYLGG